MKYNIEIERWTREVCQISIESTSPENAQQEALEIYFGMNLENEFQDYGHDKDIKDEEITVLDDDGETLVNETFDSQRNVFK
ncbi:MAG: hypothetical protein GY734_21915 [Herbaspirillum sp.]|uniref:hypothetical protein n=1 Tax=Herbaspirillum sp. TaxID=1890675 RepID=UPI00258B5DE0|nr:hypothetical protein [Herbaspirillum sp.]MCP3658524.1 hypothetical protein [Herbaspirillum sp.]MCP4033877.1 hypothetical protein [Herbaspirillum sp.]